MSKEREGGERTAETGSTARDNEPETPKIPKMVCQAECQRRRRYRTTSSTTHGEEDKDVAPRGGWNAISNQRCFAGRKAYQETELSSDMDIDTSGRGKKRVRGM